MDQVVLNLICPAPILEWNFPAEAQLFGQHVSNAEIENIDVGVILDERDMHLPVALEITKGMKITVGNNRHPLMRLKVRRHMNSRTAAVDSTPTGRQGSPGPSPLCHCL